MPTLYMPIGVPSSGKSTIRAERINASPNLCIISPDDIRFRILDFEHTKRDFDPAIEPQVWQEAFSRMGTCLEAKRDIFFDATNILRENRRSILDKARVSGYRTNAIWIQIDPELAYFRQTKRNRIVPRSVIYRMNYELEPPTHDEFHTIDVVKQWATRDECKSLHGSWHPKLQHCRMSRLI